MEDTPLSVDLTECALVVDTIRKAFQENAPALHNPWFGIVFGSMLSTKSGVANLHSWVLEQGGPSWWLDWLLFVRPKIADPNWLKEHTVQLPVDRLFTNALISSKKRKTSTDGE